MPTFPNYRGKLPEYLNPLWIGHYFLLAYWVYFRPTALHCYLYKADPRLYQMRGLGKVFASWRSKAYRHLYLMLIGAVAWLLILGGLIVLVYTANTFQRHTTQVNTVAVVSDRRAISAAADGTLKIWDLQQGGVVHSLKGHQASINAVAVTPNGQQAISASADRSLNVWDLQQGKKIHVLRGHTNWVTAVAITPDGQRAVSASGDRTLKVWDLRQGKKIHTLSGHGDTVNAVAILPQDRAISASSDGTLKVWDLQQGQEVGTLAGHTGAVKAVAVTPDGQRVVSASGDRTLKVWDLQRRSEIYTLKGHTSWIAAVKVTPDGQKAVSASSDGTLRVWDLLRGTELYTLKGHDGWVNDVALTPNGQQAISGSSDGTLKVWDLQRGTELYTFKGNTSWIRAVGVTPDGQRAISASGGLVPKVWNLNTGKEEPLKLAENILAVSAIAFRIVLVLIAISVLFSIALILAIGILLFGVAGSVLSLLLIGFISSWAFGMVFLWAEQILISPWFRDIFGSLGMSSSVLVIAFGIAIGLTFGVAFTQASRPAIGVFGSIAFILVIGVAFGTAAICFINTSEPIGKIRLASSTRLGYRVAVLFNIPVAIGAVRALFYPLQLGQVIIGAGRGKRHPVVWDEQLVLPLPGTRQYLERQLQRDEQEGLRLIAEVARNPFQRADAQRALQAYLHKSSRPLHFLYDLLNHPDMNSYVVTPVSEQDWQYLPTTKQVLLGELAGQWVDCSSDWVNQLAERWVWSLTWLRRDRRHTPLTRFAYMLSQLLDRKTIDADDFELAKYQKSYASLTDYPGGMEIASSFEELATFLKLNHLDNFGLALGQHDGRVSTASELVQELTAHQHGGSISSAARSAGTSTIQNPKLTDVIRPSVLTALERLKAIGAEMAAYQAGSSQVNQLVALTRATSELDNLEEYVLPACAIPEQAILRRIISQWRQAIAKVTGELVREL